MDTAVFELQADFCKVFSHPKRLEILCHLKTGEMGFTELMSLTELSKANLSQHLSVLRERGVVSARRDGRRLHLSVANPKITAACDLIHEVLRERIESRREAAQSIH